MYQVYKVEVRSESGQSGYPMSHPQKGGLRIDRIIRRIDRMVHRISDESDEINHGYPMNPMKKKVFINSFLIAFRFRIGFSWVGKFCLKLFSFLFFAKR